jgi:histidyl-tRNA synthetase
MAGAPLLRDELCDECAAHHAAVKAHLDDLGLMYEEDPGLVRGLDYYTRTVFEVRAEGLGAQDAIGGGGRYDRLMETIGGPPMPGLGFALGFERTLLAMEAAGVQADAPSIAEVYVARVDETATNEVFRIAQRLRGAGFATDMDHQGRSLKAQFKQAGRLGARIVLVVGPDELASGEVTMRDMDGGAERRVTVDRVVQEVRDAMDAS